MLSSEFVGDSSFRHFFAMGSGGKSEKKVAKKVAKKPAAYRPVFKRGDLAMRAPNTPLTWLPQPLTH